MALYMSSAIRLFVLVMHPSPKVCALLYPRGPPSVYVAPANGLVVPWYWKLPVVAASAAYSQSRRLRISKPDSHAVASSAEHATLV